MNEVPTPTFVKTEKADEKTPPKQAAISHAMILNKPQNSKPEEEACGWGPQCPICTQSQSIPNINAEDSEEDWNGDRQGNRKENQFKKNYYSPRLQDSPSYDFPDRLSHHYKMEKDRNERLEFLDDKYNLHFYSDPNSDSSSNHEYETLIYMCNFKNLSNIENYFVECLSIYLQVCSITLILIPCILLSNNIFIS